MQAISGQPRGGTRLARALGLDGNPLRRASDRAEAWVRIGLLAVFLVAGPLAALAAGGWAYHAGAAAARAHAAPAYPVTARAPQPARTITYLPRNDQGSPVWTGTQWQGAGASAGGGASAGTGEVLAIVMTLAFTALALLAVLRLTKAVLIRRRLAAWESAWSVVGPRWSRRTS